MLCAFTGLQNHVNRMLQGAQYQAYLEETCNLPALFVAGLSLPPQHVDESLQSADFFANKVACTPTVLSQACGARPLHFDNLHLDTITLLGCGPVSAIAVTHIWSSWAVNEHRFDQNTLGGI